jgi:hypothetical protein
MQLKQNILTYNYYGLAKIISGGQWGADRGGLEAAKAFGVDTGGCAPKGWRTSAAPAPELADFGLVENNSEDFANRTRININLSDATIIIATNINSPGTRLTIRLCKLYGKPFHVVDIDNFKTNKEDEISLLTDFIIGTAPVVVNVAGNRDYPDRSGNIILIHGLLAFDIMTKLFKQLRELKKLILISDK